jgi:hypothetical protein
VAAVTADLPGADRGGGELLARHRSLAFVAFDRALQPAVGLVGAQAADLGRCLGAGFGVAERLAAAVGQVAQVAQLLGGGLHLGSSGVGIEYAQVSARPGGERTRQLSSPG